MSQQKSLNFISVTWQKFASCLHYTIKTLYLHLFIFIPFLIITGKTFAKENAQDALNVPVGSLLARIGLGVASDGDSSVIDINPALLAAVEKQYSIFGDTNFHSGLDMFEVGVMDTLFAPIRAVIKFRQTTKSTTDIDRFIRLGLAYQIPKTHLSLGAVGTFIQSHMENWLHASESGGSLGLGALYQIDFENSPPLFLGFSAMSIFDKFQKTTFNLGLSKGLYQNTYNLHIDGSIDDKAESPKIAGGFDLNIRQFFVLRGTLGWNLKKNVLPIGAGLFFNGPKLKAFYSIATHQANSSSPWHSLGLIIAF